VALRVTACKMFREKEFGIEYRAEVSNMGTPRNSSVLELGYGWSGRTTLYIPVYLLGQSALKAVNEL